MFLATNNAMRNRRKLARNIIKFYYVKKDFAMKETTDSKNRQKTEPAAKLAVMNRCKRKYGFAFLML